MPRIESDLQARMCSALCMQVALMLNCNLTGGKLKCVQQDDLGCLNYLRKVQWNHLTEGMGKRCF